MHQYHFLIILINFGFTAFDYWKSALAFLAPVVSTIIATEVHYENVEKNLARSIILCFVYMIFFLGLITFIFSLGNLIVKNSVIRKGNGKLLDTFKDGIIVADSSDGKLMFANKAAKSFNRYLKESLCAELDDTNLVLSKDEK